MIPVSSGFTSGAMGHRKRNMNILSIVAISGSVWCAI